MTGKRMALIVGNSRYDNATRLANPENDANGVAIVLDRLNFETTTLRNATRNELIDGLDRFRSDGRDAHARLFFFAGHGLQIDGKNYLVPTDAPVLEDQAQALLATLDLDIVLSLFDHAGINIVMLDACRDNPLARSLRGRTRQLSQRGFASMEALPGTFIAFATQPGNVAYDGTGTNSPFTSALLAHVSRADVTISEMMRRVRRQVFDTTAGQQIPWEQSALFEPFLFSSTGPSGGEQMEVQDSIQSNRPDEYWNYIARTKNIALLESYEEQFPNSQNAELAKVIKAKIASDRIKKTLAFLSVFVLLPVSIFLSYILSRILTHILY